MRSAEGRLSDEYRLKQQRRRSFCQDHINQQKHNSIHINQRRYTRFTCNTTSVDELERVSVKDPAESSPNKQQTQVCAGNLVPIVDKQKLATLKQCLNKEFESLDSDRKSADGKILNSSRNQKASKSLPDLGRWFSIPPRFKGLLMLNVLTIIMSTNWVIVKNVEESMDPYMFTAIRFVVAALAFVPLLPQALQSDTVKKGGLEVGLWSALGYITQGLALTSTDASRASFLSTFTVILVPILGGLLGKGVSKATWVGSFTAILGMSLLETGGSPPSVGDIWGVVSAAFFAVQMLRTEHYSRQLSKEQTMPMISLSVATCAICAVLAAAMSHASDISNLVLHMDSIPQLVSNAHLPILPVLFTGLLSTDLVLLLELLALQYVSSLDAAIVYSLEPVLGAGLAWVALGERWGPAGWVGAAIILTSSLAVQVLGAEQTAAEPEERSS